MGANSKSNMCRNAPDGAVRMLRRWPSEVPAQKTIKSGSGFPVPMEENGGMFL